MLISPAENFAETSALGLWGSCNVKCRYNYCSTNTIYADTTRYNILSRIPSLKSQDTKTIAKKRSFLMQIFIFMGLMVLLLIVSRLTNRFYIKLFKESEAIYVASFVTAVILGIIVASDHKLKVLFSAIIWMSYDFAKYGKKVGYISLPNHKHTESTSAKQIGDKNIASTTKVSAFFKGKFWIVKLIALIIIAFAIFTWGILILFFLHDRQYWPFS